MDSFRWGFPLQNGKLCNWRKIGQLVWATQMPENIIGNAKVPVIARQKKFCWLMAVPWRTLLASCFCECHFILQLGCFASCLGHLKGKCMTKLMKVCIGNHQRIDSWKCTSTETLDKNIKTLIFVFRCWHYKTKWTKPFEVMNEMFIFNSFCI